MRDRREDNARNDALDNEAKQMHADVWYELLLKGQRRGTNGPNRIRNAELHRRSVDSPCRISRRIAINISIN
jgi:hypothetical protein